MIQIFFFSQNQVKLEILFTVKSIPLMSIPTVALFYLEVKGYSKLYDDVSDNRLGKNS